ncbi:L-threonylcarbamoyladenylate synthase [Microcoleus sp. FACHB-1515]|uniref:L-threonylcarbamoyladenylate synthase n=1 Tax=Cyanophyceae TaxID=3028117 RepID=UPI0016899371|nr:L-threonylcarbamoyladenylate synthase [Microcoleus sp. FACHB-1515]MBD2092691.1 L-threonylcarbamoyladenylate synthase [Microcoleus sp. FACHB-1515]
MPQVTLAEWIAAAQQGDSLLSFPTDTVPALAVRPDRAELIFAAKQRSQTKPLILMGATANDLWPFVQPLEPQWQQAADRYWPGAVTLVLPASDRLPPAINPADPTSVGLRVPNHPIARHLLAQTGVLATTSVNRSGEPALLHFDQINTQFPNVKTLQPSEIDRLERSGFDNPPPSGLPSTVAQWTIEGWKVLRQGNIEFRG